VYCGMPKGMWWAEVMPSSEKTKPIIVELCLSEGVGQP